MDKKLTLGKLVLDTARGDVKERILTPTERDEVLASIAKYFKGPLQFREPLDDSGAPYIYDAEGHIVAMLMWPGHPVEETAAAEQATYALGRLMASIPVPDETLERDTKPRHSDSAPEQP
jgi:hypothetical protein